MASMGMTESFKYSRGYVQQFNYEGTYIKMFRSRGEFVVSTSMPKQPVHRYSSMVEARNQYRWLVRSIKLGYLCNPLTNKSYNLSVNTSPSC